MKRLLLRQPASTATPPELGRKIKARVAAGLSEMRANGYWLCQDCGGINTREEGENGQPAHCSSCRSYRLRLQPPTSLRPIAVQLELIEPGDFLE